MDREILAVLGLAFLPALGNFGGGLLAEWLGPSRDIVNHALHAATGVILAIVAVEVMPQALVGAQHPDRIRAVSHHLNRTGVDTEKDRICRNAIHG